MLYGCLTVVVSAEHSVVEILKAPDECSPGDLVYVEGYEQTEHGGTVIFEMHQTTLHNININLNCRPR